MKVTATQARRSLALLLERVLAGEEIEIERHGRVIARLAPAEAPRHMLAGAARELAEVRGVAADSRMSRILRERAARRLEVAQPRAFAALAKLLEGGVRARLIGSMAHGSFRATSDVDFLIEDPGPLGEAAIERIVRAEMRDFPFDLVYVAKAPEPLRKRFE